MAGDGVLVALSGAPSSPALLERAATIAGRQRVPLVGVFVRTPDDPAGPTGTVAAVGEQRRELESLGGRYLEVSGEDVADTLIRVATTEGLTQIVVGASRRSRWQELRGGSLVRELTRRSPVDVLVVGGLDGATRQDRRRGRSGRPIPPIERRRRMLGWLLAVALPALSAAALVAAGDHVDLAAQLVIMLLAVLGASAVGGLGPGALAALWANVLANWCFIPPVNGLSISRAEDALALTAFLVVALVIGGAVSTAARRAAEARRARADAAALASLAGTAAGSADAVPALVEQLRVAFGAQEAELFPVRGASDHGAARHGAAGARDAEHLLLPVDDRSEVLLTGDDMHGLDPDVTSAFLHQLSLAVEQRRLRAAEEDAHRVAQVNELRATLLAAVSHDLRTPLATVKAASSALVQLDGVLEPADRLELASSVDAGVDRLTALVTNLLGMSRIRAGAVELDLRPVQVDEVVHRAALGVAHRGVPVEVSLDDDLPAVHADGALLEHVVSNLLDNACKWTPPGCPVEVDAHLLAPDTLVLRVVDHGPGIPPQDRARVRLAFERAAAGPAADDAPADTAEVEGTGLGLSVATGFCSLMGITLVLDDTRSDRSGAAGDRPGGTTASLFTPLAPGAATLEHS